MLPGSLVQWQTDFCLLAESTDDLIAVQSCIEREQARTFENECDGMRHYKLRMCQIVIAAGSRQGTVETCVSDANFSGRVVADDGV